MGVLADITSAILTILRQDTELAKILGAKPRIYHVWAPENAQLPYITYQITDLPDLDADGLSTGDLAIDLWDYAPTPERAEAAGHQITRLLDGQSIATTGGMAEAVRIVKTSSGFMETDNASVHRWMSRWTLRYVRQGEKFGGD
ncbi:MAG TPA: DUF3168 domain-containing protein [Candidatus Bipolaricaulis sp.]|nr:DUF3168 domain-containing protein [Candidatus Bipolaricaulis sp.]